VERRSDKHSAGIDEQLDHDERSMTQGASLEARVEEYRAQEGPADDEPTPDARLLGGLQARLGPSYDEIEQRNELARHLRPWVFPARPSELALTAGQERAPDDVISMLQRLPDRVYDNVQAVWLALNPDGETPPHH
jgi:uncharacterized protein DUF2795